MDASSRPSRREHWDERHSAEAPIESREPDPTLIKEIEGMGPGRALDLGSGDGRNAVWLASHGWQVTALDFSLVALKRGRTLATARGVDVDWELADLLDGCPRPAPLILLRSSSSTCRPTSATWSTRGRPRP
jgi:2-polyprenyl-3-methyl-5-hydroxy-6-metoxy-1,4-benzoquinol methylase